ncbi:hypothetical protein Nepgr_020742 [Nepenthes gracilis]|uniref:Uncharacterized protein n=1 Tax=Nepenthes gracilis TaxID=150966 RepID=A0AAD3XWP0_NEPGR|nr:hypothetical protein Nepgr_020742 [Nepenthes gracilis]
MEAMVKKYQQKFRKLREEMDHWDEHHSRLLSQFGNMSAIVERLHVIQDQRNYGSLKCVDGIEEAVLHKQMESLEMSLLSIKKTMDCFRGTVLSLQKIVCDGRQLVRGGLHQLSVKQLQQRIGVKPSLADCLDGLTVLHEMYHSEFLLKLSVVSSLSKLFWKPSAIDLGALQQLLVDQPNIPKEDVQFIFDVIFAEEIC